MSLFSIQHLLALLESIIIYLAVILVTLLANNAMVRVLILALSVIQESTYHQVRLVLVFLVILVAAVVPMELE